MRVAVYARVSRDRDGTSTSVDQQVRECRTLVESRGWDEPTVFSDNDLSAYTGKRRPAYERLLEAIRAREVDAVVCWEQSRLTRRPSELETYMEVCEPLSVPTYTVVAGTLDLTTDQGRMIARIVGATNRYEVDQLRGRVKRGVKARAVEGKPVGGRRPFGFESDRVTHRPAEADAIRKACESLIAGDSVHGIARDWRNRGLLTTTGLPWSTTQLRALLKRPRNAGHAEHRGSILGPALWDPIVTVETWSRVCTILADPDRKVSPGNTPAYLGTFIYRCGVCGELMRSWRSGRNGTRVYRCTTTERTVRHPTIPIAPTDEYVAGFVVGGLHEAGFSLIPPAPDVEESDPFADLDARQALFAEQFASGVITLEVYERMTGIIATQRAQVVDQVQVPAATASDLTDLLTEQREWSEFPLERQRALVSEFADVVINLSEYRRQPVLERVRIKLDLSID